MRARTTTARCQSKIAYKSRGEAKQCLREWSRNRNTNNVEAYSCNICGNWHLGTRMNRNVIKSRRRKASR